MSAARVAYNDRRLPPGEPEQMSNALVVTITSFVISFITCFVSMPAATAGESTMPEKYADKLSPELARKYIYTEDGDYTKALKIPTYEWMPADSTPKALVLGVHGLTLHGRRFRVLARLLSVNGIGFVAPDMRGFGRCKFDDKNQFSTPEDDKSKVNHHKSYDEIVQLSRLMKQKYPGVRLIALGESLGCTFCVRLAAEHPDLVDAILLSAPAVRLNVKMFVGHGTVKHGMESVVSRGHEMDLHAFLTNLVSTRQDVVDEMLDDPLILKQMPMPALYATDRFVAETAKWGKGTPPHLPVLILQGSQDGCVSPKHVTTLMNNMPSDDQTLAWRGHYGHLQLETMFMRDKVIDAIVNFLHDHTHDNEARLATFQQQITDLGGTLIN
jgi:alpha-beta hydrolase superfamily lysophospholipase